MRAACDGPGLLAAFRAAVAGLETHVEEINALNVYPVPDGDTGSNMLATVRAALDEAERVSDPTLERVSGAIALGALMGARGNSGVILSQIFRGMAESLGGKRTFNGLDLAHALVSGNRAGYRAVTKPVEGTILSVIRESAEFAVLAAESADGVEAVLTAAVAGADAALEKTPSQLLILREAGVVDAGGAGLVRLFTAALQDLVGHAPTPSKRSAVRASAPVPQADGEFGYETMYLLQPRPGGTLDVDAIRSALELMGDSVIVAGDHRAVKVHVHGDRPDRAIAYGLEQGALSRISVENLDAQAREVREGRANDFTTGQPALASVEVAPISVIAVASGDGLAAVFRSLGSSSIVSGGQGANPSTGELLAAIEAAAGLHILLLPNHSSVLLAARQAAGISSRPVTVVPTRNAAEGLAALLALDPAATPSANAQAMTKAGRAIQSFQVTHAIRDANLGGRRIRQGEVIVLDPDDGLIAADSDETTAVVAGVDALRPGSELLTLYYGDGVEPASAEALGRRIGEHRPELEIEIVRGGQPHYRYLIAAE